MPAQYTRVHKQPNLLITCTFSIRFIMSFVFLHADTPFITSIAPDTAMHHFSCKHICAWMRWWHLLTRTTVSFPLYSISSTFPINLPNKELWGRSVDQTITLFHLNSRIFNFNSFWGPFKVHLNRLCSWCHRNTSRWSHGRWRSLHEHASTWHAWPRINIFSSAPENLEE